MSATELPSTPGLMIHHFDHDWRANRRIPARVCRGGWSKWKVWSSILSRLDCQRRCAAAMHALLPHRCVASHLSPLAAPYTVAHIHLCSRIGRGRPLRSRGQPCGDGDRFTRAGSSPLAVRMPMTIMYGHLVMLFLRMTKDVLGRSTWSIEQHGERAAGCFVIAARAST